MKSSKSPFVSSFRILSMAAMVAAGLVLGGAAAAAPIRATSIQVEAIPSGPLAAIIRRTLAASLERELAQRPIDAPPGARLVIRVTEVFLSSDSGPLTGGGFGRSGGGLQVGDAMDGEALVVDQRGNVLQRKRIAARLPISFGGVEGSPNNEPRRVAALSDALAYWTVREF